MSDSKFLLEDLKRAFEKLELPSDVLKKVIDTTEGVFECRPGSESSMPLTAQVDNTIHENNVITTRQKHKFNGVDNNLYSALPNELRMKVLEYLTCLRRAYYDGLDLEDARRETKLLINLQRAFPNDELIAQKMNSHVKISFADVDIHKVPIDAVGDFEILRKKNDYFKYKAESVSFIASSKCGETALRKFGKVINKEKQLQNIRALSFSSFDAMRKITFDKSNFILHSLEIVQFDLTEISVLENLECFPNLRTLECASTCLKQVKDLSYLTRIKTMNLSDNVLTAIPAALNNLRSLKVLRLSSNRISKIENLSNLKNLEVLDLSMNNIQTIENLDGLKSLTTLGLADNRDIIQIKNLDSLSKLTTLTLANTSVLRIENLSKLSNLVTLNLSQTNVSKLENLDHLINLKCLFLRNCTNGSFKKLENLENLTNLVEFVISPCQDITHLENLDTLVNLQMLVVNRHSLTKFDNVANLKKLKILDLAFGTLEDVGELNKLTSLENIDFSFNKIDRIGDVTNLRKLQRLSINELEYFEKAYPTMNAFLKALEDLKNEELDEDMEYFNDIRRIAFSDPFQYPNLEVPDEPYPDFVNDDPLFNDPHFQELLRQQMAEYQQHFSPFINSDEEIDSDEYDIEYDIQAPWW